MLDAARYTNKFISGTRPRILQLGQRIVPEAPPSSSDEDEDIQLEPEDYKQSGTARPIKSSAKKTGGGGGRSNVTLRDLVDAQLLEPGEDCIVVTYKGTSYTASLSDDCTIVYQGKPFTSATAFSMHCKRLQTPGKQGDDGWKSVQYAGKHLDTYRSAYLRTIREQQQNGAASSSSHEGAADDRDDDAQNGPARSGNGERAAEGDEATDQWVQCERCKLWRVVPDEYWQEVSTDEGSAWLCESAAWDVTALTPHKAACIVP